MYPIDNIRIATRNFKTRKLRTFLTILGIGIGIATTLFLVSLGYGLQKVLLEKIATSDTLLTLDVTVENPEEKFTQEKIDVLSNLDGVAEVSPVKNATSIIDTGNVLSNVTLFSVAPSYFRLGGVEVLEGEKFENEDDAKIILSTGAARTIGFSDSPKELIGKEVDITIVIPEKDGSEDAELITTNNTVKLDKKFIVVGLADDDVSSYGYLPISWVNGIGIDDYESAKIKAQHKDLLGQVRDAIIGSGFEVQAISDTVDEANKIFTVIQIVLAMFGIVALMVSAIGTFNTMTIALLERTSEIGIMKSIGASDSEIRMLFLSESILIGFLGGIGGAALGFAIAGSVNFGFNFMAKNLGGDSISIFYTPIWFIFFIISFSTIVGLLTGVYPAARAAKINPLVALRYK